MIKLEIRKVDGSLYWSQPFDDDDSALKWLAQEKTRPYWDNSYTHELVRPPIDPVKEAEILADKVKYEAVKAKIEAAEIQLKAIDWVKLDKKDPEIVAILKAICERLGL